MRRFSLIMAAFTVCLLALILPSMAWAEAPTVPADDFSTGQLAALLMAHKWVPAAAIVIWLLVRLQKAGRLPGMNRIPENYRPFLALGLGIVSGVLDKVAVDSKTWLVAILDGLLSGAIAIVGHDTIIEGFRGGAEPLGGGSKNPAPVVTPAGKPDSLTPPTNGGAIVLAIVLVLAPTNTACAAFQSSPNSQAALVLAADLACAIANAELPDNRIASVCQITEDFLPQVLKLLSVHRVEQSKAIERAALMSPAGANRCADAGAK